MLIKTKKINKNINIKCNKTKKGGGNKKYTIKPTPPTPKPLKPIKPIKTSKLIEIYYKTPYNKQIHSNIVQKILNKRKGKAGPIYSQELINSRVFGNDIPIKPNNEQIKVMHDTYINNLKKYKTNSSFISRFKSLFTFSKSTPTEASAESVTNINSINHHYS